MLFLKMIVFCWAGEWMLGDINAYCMHLYTRCFVNYLRSKMKKNLTVYCLLFIVVLGVSPTLLMAQDKVIVIPLNSTPKSASVSLSTTIRTSQFDKGVTYGSFVSEIGEVSCNFDEVITGGSCSARSDNMDSATTNWGVVSSCDIVGNSVLGFAYPDAYLYDSNLYGPAITVYAVCAKKVIDTVAKISTSKEALVSSKSLEDAKAKMQVQIEALRQAHESKR